MIDKRQAALMQEEPLQSKETGLDVGDVIYAVSKHKWRILACTAAGVLAAGVFLYAQLQNEYQAKLLVRYVVERSAIDPVDSQTKLSATGADADSAINSEVEILTSVDLAEQVAEAVGPQRLHSAPVTGDRKRAAARDIATALKVKVLKGTNVILVSYRNNDPKLANEVLQELVSRYFDKHLQVHRSLGAFDFVTAQTNKVRTQLQQTEDDLKKLKETAGIRSLAEATTSIDTELAASRTELHAARVELAEQRARVREVERALSGPVASTAVSDAPTLTAARAVQQYEALGTALAQLHAQQVSLSAKFTPENRAVQVNKLQIEELEARRRQLESAYPHVVTAAPSKSGGPTGPVSLVAERAHLVACEAKTVALESQVSEVEARAKRLTDMAAQIAQLERDQNLEEANYKYFQVSLEKARVDEALDPSKIPNISVVQKPSAAPRDTPRILKGAAGFAGGGLAAGILLAFLTEMVFDPTVKRTKELETRCGIPVCVSIPDVTEYTPRCAPEAPWSPAAPADARLRSSVARKLTPYCADIRDRLAMLFDFSEGVRRPKLIAVTALESGGGATTIAGGLAAVLAQTIDGKVMLVDMTVDATQATAITQHTRPSLAEALRARGASGAFPANNLCLATVGQTNQWEGRVVPRRFYDLMPELKTSDFDYIIFDMPPLGQTSVALAMAGLMDRVLLIVEADKSDRNTVTRAFRELTDARASISVILNKLHFHGPKWLHNTLC